MHVSDRLFDLLIKRHDNHREMERLMSVATAEGRTLRAEEAASFDALARDVEDADRLIAYLRETRVTAPVRAQAQPSPVTHTCQTWHPPIRPIRPHDRAARKAAEHPLRPAPRPIDACDCTLAGGELLLGRYLLNPTPFSEMEPTPTFGSSRQ